MPSLSKLLQCIAIRLLALAAEAAVFDKLSPVAWDLLAAPAS